MSSRSQSLENFQNSGKIQALSQPLGQSHSKPLSGRRVLFLAPQPFIADRGSPMRVHSTLEALSDLGAEIDLIAFPFGEDVKIDRLSIHRSAGLPWSKEPSIGPSWRKIGFDGLLFWKALGLVRKNQYDVIHGVEEAAFLAGVLARFTKTPYIFDLHSWMSEQIADRGFVRNQFLLSRFQKLEERTLRKAGGFITVGTVMTDRARAIAPNVAGVSLEDLPLTRFEPVTEFALRQLREQHGLENKRVLLYTGNFVPYQGIELLLRGYREFLNLENSVNTHLLLVGGGDAHDPSRIHYESLAKELGLLSTLTFVGQKPVGEMGKFYALADAFISPRIDGTNPPLKVYSYMAAEKIIVATRMSSHTQVLSDDSALLTELTPSGLALGICKAIGDDSFVQVENRKRIANAKTLVETEYSPSAFRRKLLTVYTAVCGLCAAEPAEDQIVVEMNSAFGNVDQAQPVQKIANVS